MNEIGFYGLGAYGVEPTRIAAIARHLPNSAVYVVGRTAIRRLFSTHGITTIVPAHSTPAEMDRWLRARNPDRLVMDAYPYGVLTDDAHAYVTGRAGPTYYLRRRTTHTVDYEPAHFTDVLNTDEGLDGGTDMHPVLAFDADQLLPRRAARSALGATNRPLVLIIGRGNTPAFAEYVIRCCDARGVDHAIIDTYPVMPSMPGADLVVGYVGHNQCEAEAVGVPMAGIINTADPGQSWRPNVNAGELADLIATLDVRDAPETVTYTDRSRAAAALIDRGESSA